MIRIFFLLILLLLPLRAKEILLLHSYNNGLKWSDGITQGVSSIIHKYPEYELSIEYMDSKKIDTDEYFHSLLQLYIKKFSKRHYDIVITSDNYAFEFALKHKQQLFASSKIVFCGVENFQQNKIPQKLTNQLSGVIEYKDIKKNLSVMKQLLPKLSHVYIISDDSFSSRQIQKQILQEAKSFENDFSIEYDNQIDISTLSQKLHLLPKHSAVLFTSLYKDKNGNYIPYNKIRELFQSSPYPIFALNNIHLGNGVVGGAMIDPFEQGQIAAQKAVMMLHDAKVESLGFTTPQAKNYFDFIALERYQIPHKLLPKDAIVINEPQGFFEKYRKLIDTSFFILPLLVLLIAGLFVNIIKRIDLEIKLLEQTKLDDVLLNNIQSAIFWKSTDDILLGCNDSFANLVQQNRQKIIGQKIDTIIPQLQDVCKKSDADFEEFETMLQDKFVLIRRQKYLDKLNRLAGMVVVINDISRIKKLEIQRKKEEQFVSQRSKLSEIGEMMTSITHQFKSPLVEISTIAQEIFYKLQKKRLSSEDAKIFVDDIMTQVSFMSDTIDSFRDFLKPSYHKHLFYLDSAINELLSLIEHSMKYNYIHIIKEFQIGNYALMGYPNELKQVILNLINNAKESILKKREIEPFDALIEICLWQTDLTIELRIKDNGCGIQQASINKIFEPFFTDKKDGDGFGLYLARLIVEDKMNGHIWAEESECGAILAISFQKEHHEDTST